MSHCLCTSQKDYLLCYWFSTISLLSKVSKISWRLQCVQRIFSSHSETRGLVTTVLIFRYDNPTHLTQTHYTFLVRQPCMDGYVFPIKFVTTALIWHSYVLWNISWEILFWLLRQPCTILYEIHVISIRKWSLASTYFITKSLLFRCENSATVTNSLYQRLQSPCKFRYDIPVFSYIPIFGVTKALFFWKNKLVTWRLATFSLMS